TAPTRPPQLPRRPRQSLTGNATWSISLLFQPPIEPLIRHFPHIRREIVIAIEVVGLEFVPGAEQLVDRARRRDTLLDAVHVEVMVAHRGAGEEGARGQRRHDLGKVERHLLRLQLVARADARHVAVVTPALEVTLEIRRETAEATVRDDALDARVEDG